MRCCSNVIFQWLLKYKVNLTCSLLFFVVCLLSLRHVVDISVWRTFLSTKSRLLLFVPRPSIIKFDQSFRFGDDEDEDEVDDDVKPFQV